MGALEGVKILDFSTLLPGPYATLMLADMGADVLRVTRPGSYDLVTNWGDKIEGSQVTGVAAGANHAVIGILAALYSRAHTGKGQHIDISMADGVIPFNSMDGAAFLSGGVLPKREGGLLNGGGIYDYYRTADGGYMSVGSLEPKFFAALCEGFHTVQVLSVLGYSEAEIHEMAGMA